jgi:hypothetical protein
MFEFIINGLVTVSFLAVIGITLFYQREKAQKFAWWKWILLVLWLVGFLIVFGFIGTAIGEDEPGAALRGGGAFLAILAVMTVVFYRLLFGGWGNKPGKAAAAKTENEAQ